MTQLFANNAFSALAVAASAAATSISVQAGHGARFPTPVGGDYFLLTLFQMVAGVESNHEIVKVTARAIDTLTIVRAQEGTTARAFGVGDQVSLRATAGTLNGLAQLGAPAVFTMSVNVPTVAAGNSSTSAASTAFVSDAVSTAVAGLVDSSPAALDTLNELAAALGDDANFATTTATSLGNRLRVDTAAQGLTAQQKTNAKTNIDLQNVTNTSDANKPVSTAQQTALNLKANLASPTFTGTVAVPDLAAGTNTTAAANTKFVTAAISTAVAVLAPLASPTFTGVVTVPTAAAGDNTTAAASTAFVTTAVANLVDASPAALNTLNELAAALGDDPNFATTMSTSLGNRLRVDVATQGLDATQKTNALTNLGIQNINNTSDANKPVSTAQQTALNLKANLATPSFTTSLSIVAAGATLQIAPDGVSGTNGVLYNTSFVAGGNGPHKFAIGGTERVRIDAFGNLLVGTTSGDRHIIKRDIGVGDYGVLRIFSYNDNEVANFIGGHQVNNVGANGALAALYVGRYTPNNRSINVVGTVNASGADYAEYMAKDDACGELAKGAVVGVTADGKLTDSWNKAVSFVVKSTDPSLVGGDVWGTNLEGDELEAARQKVDRIAFAGQVPVNVYGAQPGQFIVPGNFGGTVGGIAMDASKLTMDLYIRAVGIVQNILPDGRANVRVKVV